MDNSVRDRRIGRISVQHALHRLQRDAWHGRLAGRQRLRRRLRSFRRQPGLHQVGLHPLRHHLDHRRLAKAARLIRRDVLFFPRRRLILFFSGIAVLLSFYGS